jgi:hypothetical protein
MTKGQEWTDEFYVKFHTQGVIKPLPDFLDHKIEELRDEYQKEVLKAWNAGFEYAEHLIKYLEGANETVNEARSN